jgi:hypothetical protein
MASDAHYHAPVPQGLQDDEDRSIGTAMRATLCFVAIVLLLVWAGASNAAGSGAPPAPAVAARSG